MAILLRRALLLALFLPMAGCETLRYYGQAVHGQLALLAAREPIPERLADEATPEALKERLRLVERVRTYAAEALALPVDGAYRHYADLGRDYVVWNVTAAPAFDLTLKTWCFPIAGCVRYKGYFNPSDAEAAAERLRSAGYDVSVAGVQAYSTLGWFDDPVLNTFVGLPERDLAELIFHELTHRRIYIPGDTILNESLATAYARFGVARFEAWTGAAGHPLAAAGDAQEHRAAQQWFLQQINQTLEALATLYQAYRENPASRSLAEWQALKQNHLDQLVERLLAADQPAAVRERLRHWVSRAPLNNARLLAVQDYHRWVPAFEVQLERLGKDPVAFLAWADELGRQAPEERIITLEGLMPADADPAQTPSNCAAGCTSADAPAGDR